MSRVFASGPGDQGSMELDNSLLNTQNYKVRINGKVEQTMGLSSALP